MKTFKSKKSIKLSFTNTNTLTLTLSLTLTLTLIYIFVIYPNIISIHFSFFLNILIKFSFDSQTNPLQAIDISKRLQGVSWLNQYLITFNDYFLVLDL